MADEVVSLEGSYQQTTTYREASPARRRQLNRYKKECGISDEHMLLLLAKSELDSPPKERQTRSSTASTVVLLVAVLLFFNSMSTFQSMGTSNASLVFFAISFVSFLLAMGVYFTGALDPYKRAQRAVRKRLKGMPEVPDFTEWDLAHPSQEDRKARKASRRS